MQRTLDDVVGALMAGRRYNRPCSLLIGAGCSASAGIRTATGFVQLIREHHWPAYDRAKEKTYPHCLAALETGYRRDLIADEIRRAKINWAHVAIAQLIAEGYVDRVLTTNFDPLVARACALVSEFPAVYDFAASTLFRPAEVADKAIFHLHGQSTGFVLMNTEDECTEHGQRLGPLFQDAGRGRSWIVVGYSGDNDPVFQHLAAVERFEYGLYWVGYLDAEPTEALRRELLTHGNQAYFVKGYDADRFFVELTQKLKCFPPEFVERPFTHLRGMFEAFTPFRPLSSPADVDVLEKPRRLLDLAIGNYEPKEGEEAAVAATKAAPPTQDALELAATALLMAGRYHDVQAVAERLDDESKRSMASIIAWSFLAEGDELSRRAEVAAGDEAEALFVEAAGKYSEAVQLKPNLHWAYNNWGLVLAARAHTKEGIEAYRLFREAEEKYTEAVRLKPTNYEALSNWGSAPTEWARKEDGDEAEALFRKAAKKFDKAVSLKPDKYLAFYNLALALAHSARTKDSESAEELFQESVEKYAEAAELEPDRCEIFYEWGITNAAWARIKHGKAARDLYEQAAEKYAKAVRIKPDMNEAYYTWRLALYAWGRISDAQAAEALFREGAEKFGEAVRLKPDMHEAFNNWGLALLAQTRLGDRGDAEALLCQAEEKLKRAEALKSGSGAYNLACVASLRGQEEKCREWLEVARRFGTLEDRAHLESDPDLDPVRETDWFRVFIASV